MEKTKIKSGFILKFNREIRSEIINNKIGLSPTNFSCDTWIYETGFIREWDFDKIIPELMKKIDEHKEEIRELLQIYDGHFTFNFIAQIEYDDKPCINFHHDYLDIIDYLNAEINIDFIINSTTKLIEEYKDFDLNAYINDNEIFYGFEAYSPYRFNKNNALEVKEILTSIINTNKLEYFIDLEFINDMFFRIYCKNMINLKSFIDLLENYFTNKSEETFREYDLPDYNNQIRMTMNLVFNNNFDLNLITNCLGINPRRIKEKEWHFVTPNFETTNFNEVIRFYKDTFRNKINELKDLLIQYNGNCYISIVPKISRVRKLNFFIDYEFLNLVKELNSCLYFDVYLL